MIISKTPYRISFFGGGTDYPCWYNKNKGQVLTTSIDKYCYITCRTLPPFFKHKHRIVYSKIEDVQSISEIQHPSARACMRFMRIKEGLEIHHDGDLPARSGLGSSSAFTVGLLNALYALKGRVVSPAQLTADAIHVEQDMLRENVGSQDQVISAHGGFNIVTFGDKGHLQVRPITLPAARIEELQSRLMLFYTGIVRTASDIAGTQIRKTPARGKELSAMYDMVDRAVEILDGRTDISEFGRLMHENWLIKRSLTDKITNPVIDQVYSSAIKSGAVGGKILGAGGGGFMLLFAEPKAQPRIRAALKKLLHVPFKFDYSGSSIIFYRP
ncbi:MAG: kinase [Elusimicrobia bacterium GWC2_56_31]|nr:MAG: kinase [Elusimicrobia bacterium GWC2_56_31]HBB67685.1 kinase [Elusimicrobiota bacterium]HBW22867.1 kinase [Elusimicrobiota bacterium]